MNISLIGVVELNVLSRKISQFNILDVPTADVLDQILLDLPIMQKLGQHVQVDVTPLRKYEDFASDLKSRLNRN